jgi:hypothetical protein
VATTPFPVTPEPGAAARSGAPLADDELARARLVAEAVAQAAAGAGVPLDDKLLVWELAGGTPATPAGRGAAGTARVEGGVDGADRLGRVLEAATDGRRRRTLGLHVTPRWLAEELVDLALPPAGPVPGDGSSTVCDPACGGGAFLVAAARHLHASGLERRHVVRHLLWGADVDPVGLATAEAALYLWSGERPPPGRLVVADPLLGGAGVWPDPPAGGFAAVVGNPPFQSQLGQATARTAADRRRLRARFGDAVRAYTDTAWLFLLVGCDLVRPGGRVVLVEPQSIVAARDAEALRRAVDRQASLRDLWVDEGRVFDAAVRVCAPVLEKRHDETAPGMDGGGSPAGGRSEAAVPGAAGGRSAGDRVARWGRMWARVLELPLVDVGFGPALGERATVVAGFRDQYYGLVCAVRELDPAEAPGDVAPLVTSGVVDWAACGWGERPVRYAKRRWEAPVVDRARLARDAPPIAQRWVERTTAPKLIVATQTRVVEAAIDVEGRWVPSVPTVAVVPHDAEDLWRLAAAVLSPAATMWLTHRAAGTGLDRGALKVAGPDLAALPLPLDADAWDEAAEALRAYVAAPGDARLGTYLDAAGRAYPGSAPLAAWWRGLAGTAVRSLPPGG